MFATLLASGGVYLYAQHTSSQLDMAIGELNSEIGSFSQADMERVTQFNSRLLQAKDRLENSVSVTSVFEALQAATIDTVQINSLTMEREEDERFVIEADVETDSFDSTIFQRGVFLRNGTIQEVDILDVQNAIATEGGETPQESTSRPIISFRAILGIPLEEVSANPQSYQSTQTGLSNTNTQTSQQSVEQEEQEGQQQEQQDNDDTL